MEYVYFLEHSYEEGEYDIVTDIAVYSSKVKAEKAICKFQKYPKFKKHPEGFNIDMYKVDQSEWGEGFFIWNK